jgi:Kelch motif
MKRFATAPHLAIALGVATLALGTLAPGASASPLFSKLPAEMTEARFVPVAAALPDGKVLIAGGYNGSTYSNTAELFNPSTEKFEKLAGEMTEPRYEAAAAALPDGKVLIVGG